MDFWSSIDKINYGYVKKSNDDNVSWIVINTLNNLVLVSFTIVSLKEIEVAEFSPSDGVLNSWDMEKLVKI